MGGYYVLSNNTDEEDVQQANLKFLSYQYVFRRDVITLFNTLGNIDLKYAGSMNINYALLDFVQKEVGFFAFGTRVSHEPFFLLNGSGWFEVVQRLIYIANSFSRGNSKFRCKISAPTHHRFHYTDLSGNRKSQRDYGYDDDSGDGDHFGTGVGDDYGGDGLDGKDQSVASNTPSTSVNTGNVTLQYSNVVQEAWFENISWLHYEIVERCKCFTQSSFEDNFNLEWVKNEQQVDNGY